MTVKGRSLLHVDPDEVLVWSDRVKEEGLGVLDPRHLPIKELAFPRWAKSGVHHALTKSLPCFPVKVEGRPKGMYATGKSERRRWPHQCEHRDAHLFEKKSLDMLLTLLGVTNLDRHSYSPLWYVVMKDDVLCDVFYTHHENLNIAYRIVRGAPFEFLGGRK